MTNMAPLENAGADRIAVFSRASQFEKAHDLLSRLQLPFTVVSPGPAYSLVGAPALVCDARGVVAINGDHSLSCAGFAGYWRPSKPRSQPDSPHFAEDIFGEAVTMFFAACARDETRIRLIAHLSGDVTAALPYVNAVMPQARFTGGSSSLTFVDGGRVITLYSRRITLSRAEGLEDAWRTLEQLRVQINRIWAQRATLTPLYTLRSKPSALEIYKRLPKSNCAECGEQTCLAFAVRLSQGNAHPSECVPIFEDRYTDLQTALLEICQGLETQATSSAAPERMI